MVEKRLLGETNLVAEILCEKGFTVWYAKSVLLKLDKKGVVGLLFIGYCLRLPGLGATIENSPASLT